MEAQLELTCYLKLPSHTWSENDKCLVRNVYGKIGKWHRALIRKVIDDEKIQVFLLDYGKIVDIDVNNMVLVPDEFLTTPPRAIRARLAFSSLNNKSDKEWPQTSIESFQNITKRYESFAVSLIDESGENGSILVVLYGVPKDGKSDVTMHHNILEYLYLNGKLDANLNILNNHKDRLVNPWNMQFYNEENADDDGSRICAEILEQQKELNQQACERFSINKFISIDKLPKRIKSWIPSQNKYKVGDDIYGLATHIGDDGSIFIQTIEQTHIVENLADFLTNNYGNPRKMSNKSSTFNPGDCVIARFPDGSK